jgi:hypothetical protein
MSGWSSFRLGMTRPELSVLGVGEWERPGGDDWGVMIRDLRTGEERVVFDEAEWEHIKKRGLPPVGTSWGESFRRQALPPGVEDLIAVERDLYQASKSTDSDHAVPRSEAEIQKLITQHLREGHLESVTGEDEYPHWKLHRKYFEPGQPKHHHKHPWNFDIDVEPFDPEGKPLHRST